MWPTSGIESTLQKYDIGVTKIAQNTTIIHNTPQITLKSVTRQHLTLSIPSEGNYKLALFSADGRMLGTISTGLLTQGEHAIPWNLDNVSHGIYFIRVNSGNLKTAEKIVLP